MGLWNFLGGNKIGPGHPRYERELRKHNERQKLQLRIISIAIMRFVMPEVLRYKEEKRHYKCFETIF